MDATAAILFFLFPVAVLLGALELYFVSRPDAVADLRADLQDLWEDLKQELVARKARIQEARAAGPETTELAGGREEVLETLYKMIETSLDAGAATVQIKLEVPEEVR